MTTGPRNETAIRVDAFRGKVPLRSVDPPIAPSLDHRAVLIDIKAQLNRIEALLTRREEE